jgi:tetratricopeptide (TPR) repeat protein
LQESHKTENLQNAIGMFERALENDGQYALAHAGLGEAYWQLFVRTSDPGFVDKAVESCQRALESNDQLVEVHVTLGHINGGTGKYEEAVKNYTAALEVDARNADAFAGLAGVDADSRFGTVFDTRDRTAHGASGAL